MPTIRSRRTTEPLGTTVDFDGSTPIAGYAAAVSLHAHTNRSREGMSFIRPYIDRIPLIAPLARREMKAYEQRNGRSIDFSKGWWSPPVEPTEVWESEKSQIERCLGLRAMVSISDHDSVAACLLLHETVSGEYVPLSFEWTVPWGKGFLHLGVHNIPHDCGADVFEALEEYTQDPDRVCLRGLLDRLHESPETLVVFNHPCWDLADVGRDLHAATVRAFLLEHGDRIHALELNGYRSASENDRVVQLARTVGIPLVSGGDRHGRAPNTLLNLTTATSFGEFAQEIREEHRSVILVMPEYRQALVSRKLGVAGDAVRAYPSSHGQPHWTDRVSYEGEGVERRLSDHWPTGGPFWVRSAVTAFERATRPPFLHALRLLVWMAGASMSGREWPPLPDEPGIASRGARVASEELPG